MASHCRTTPLGGLCVSFSITAPAIPHGMPRKTSRSFSKGVANGSPPVPAPRLADGMPRQKSRFFTNGVFNGKQLPTPSSEDERKSSTPAPAEHVANFEALVNRLGSEVESLRSINRAARNEADGLRSHIAKLRVSLASYTQPTEPLLINGVLLGRSMSLDEFSAASLGTAPVMETGRHTEPSRSNSAVSQASCHQGRDSAFSEGPDFGRPMAFDEFAIIYGSSVTTASALSSEMGRYPGILAPKPIHPRAPLLDRTDF